MKILKKANELLDKNEKYKGKIDWVKEMNELDKI